MISKLLVLFVALLALTAGATALVQDEQNVYKACGAKGAKQKAFQKAMTGCVFGAVPGATTCQPGCAYLLKSSAKNKKCRASLYRFLTQLSDTSVPTIKATCKALKP